MSTLASPIPSTAASMAETEVTTCAVVAAAVLFSLLLFSNVFQLLRHKAWYFIAFTAALLLESGGFAALGYVKTHVTDHTAYVVSFATLTLGPALLVLATISAFGRLLKTSQLQGQSTGFRTLWLPRSFIAPICIIIQVVAIMFFVYGIVSLSSLHSSAPIKGSADALARLLFEAHAIAMFSTGYIMQFICLALFAIVSQGAMDTGGSAADDHWRKIRWAVQSVTTFSLARTGVKVATYASLDPQTLDILGVGTAAWLLDVVPLICAFAIFTKCYPTFTKHPTISEPAHDAVSEKTTLLLLDYDNAMTC